MNDISFNVETITPAWAFQKLRESGFLFDQKVSPDVAALAQTMKDGLWKLNGDAIVLDQQGKVIDGLKRLQACHIAKQVITSVVVNGIPRANRLTIGIHRPRRNSDFLKVKGVPHHSLVSRLMNAAVAMQDGVYVARKSMKPDAAIATYERYKDRLDRAAEFVACHKDWVIDQYVVGLFHFLLAPIDVEAAEAFLLHGFRQDKDRELDQDDVRTKLLSRFVQNHQLGINLKRIEKFGLITKAWNSFFNKEGKKLLKWNSGGGEVFPTIAGWTTANNLDLSASAAQADLFAPPAEKDAELEITLEEIDVDTAREYLELNRENNRNLVLSTVEKYAKDMRNGDWQINGQAIKFDRDGNCFDGQHRLTGALRAGTSFISLVVRNVDNNAFSTYDTRAAKTFKDVLTTSGDKYASHLQGLLNRAIRWEKNAYQSAYEVSLPEMERYLKDNEWLKELVASQAAIIIREADRRGGSKLFKPTSSTFVLWMLSRIDSARAAVFFEKVFMGTTTGPEDQAIVMLRNYKTDLISKQRKQAESARVGEIQEVTALIRAWNAWVGGYELRKADIALKDGERVPTPAHSNF
jgi:hypothetical protein